MSGHNELTEFIRRHQAIVLALTLNDLQVADERLMNRLANGPIAIASSPNYGSWHADILVRFDADRNSFESISDRGVRLVAIRNGIMTEAANRVSRVNDAIPRRERAGRSREFESESMFEDAERFVIQAV
jgi:hypothetical protein